VREWAFVDEDPDYLAKLFSVMDQLAFSAGTAGEKNELGTMPSWWHA
jgi:hypothetical protein